MEGQVQELWGWMDKHSGKVSATSDDGVPRGPSILRT